MASKTVALDKTWQKLDTGSATAIVCQNTGSIPLSLKFSAAPPSPEESGFIVAPGQGYPRTTEADDMYAKVSATEGGKCEVSE